MKSNMNSYVAARRVWTAPELKKVDLKQITAGGSHTNEHDAANKS
jgi:hypothetical protein